MDVVPQLVAERSGLNPVAGDKVLIKGGGGEPDAGIKENKNSEEKEKTGNDLKSFAIPLEYLVLLHFFGLIL